jgi:hypothetical protein
MLDLIRRRCTIARDWPDVLPRYPTHPGSLGETLEDEAVSHLTLSDVRR